MIEIYHVKNSLTFWCHPKYFLPFTFLFLKEVIFHSKRHSVLFHHHIRSFFCLFNFQSWIKSYQRPCVLGINDSIHTDQLIMQEYTISFQCDCRVYEIFSGWNRVILYELWPKLKALTFLYTIYLIYMQSTRFLI